MINHPVAPMGENGYEKTSKSQEIEILKINIRIKTNFVNE
jgi:hypothetical protein